jgi:hypothetical protein
MATKINGTDWKCEHCGCDELVMHHVTVQSYEVNSIHWDEQGRHVETGEYVGSDERHEDRMSYCRQCGAGFIDFSPGYPGYPDYDEEEDDEG